MSISAEEFEQITLVVTKATSNLEVTLHEHARDTRASLTELGRSVAVTTTKIEGILEVVKPIPTQIATLETHVDNLHEGNRFRREEITEVKTQLSDLEIKLAASTPAIITKTSGNSFWLSANFKYVLAITTILITGLLALAGYQIEP